MNVQLHKKMVRPWNGNKVFVYKYMNTKNSMVCKAMNLKDLSCLSFFHFIATETLDLPGILGTFKMVEHSYQAYCILKRLCLRIFNSHGASRIVVEAFD